LFFSGKQSDLILTESNGVFTTTISPNAEWGGVQRFEKGMKGGVSVCNWYWPNNPPSVKTCNNLGSGIYRSWTSDKNGVIHLSKAIKF